MLNEKLFTSGDVIGVATSGGKDSACLLHLLLKSADRLNITVKALNVEHGIRGEQSKADSEFVKEQCKNLGVPLMQTSVDCVAYAKANGLSLEESARKLRYDFLKSALESGFCTKIATAHHLSDNVETLLLNLFRGTSPSGFKGIPEVAWDGKLIRPILGASREQIDRFINDEQIPFVTDDTNFSDDYTRNFLRLKVIPTLKERFPEMESALLRFSSLVSLDDEVLTATAKNETTFSGQTASVNLGLSPPVFSRACVMALKGLGVKKDYEKAHIDALIGLQSAQTGKKITLLNGVVAIKEYSKITFYKTCEPSQFTVPFSVGVTSLPVGEIIVCKNENITAQNGERVLKFDVDKIPPSAVIRYRKRGDKFTKFGGGTKSLGDYMTDKKIPLRERDFIPLIADGNNVLAILGCEISDEIKVTEQTSNVCYTALKTI
ncbi:MAG: tRNA lysidine(34) synthetase TilS [Clostridia bacterium]|nr:tRNA lysidine(34) synthetase TilS [Clostridia bacterium]